MGYEKYLGIPGNGSRRNFKRTPATTAESKSEYVVNFDRLDGGLNIYELDYRLDANESPNMKNLHWKDGALGCRSGQEYVIDTPPVSGAVGFSAYSELFWDYIFVHIGNKIYCTKPGDSMAYTELKSGLTGFRGVFFRYGEELFYKNKGSFYRITYVPDKTVLTDRFVVTSVPLNAYTPITYINMNPTTHAGTAYQPENRLSSKKTLWYSAVTGVADYYLPVARENNLGVTDVFVDGVRKYPDEDSGTNFANPESYVFSISENADILRKVVWYGNETPRVENEIPSSAYTFDSTNHTVTITDSTYHGKPNYTVYWTHTRDYAFTPAEGKVTFHTAPDPHTPTEVNTVKITYSTPDDDFYFGTYRSIMMCDKAIVYGGDQNLCIVLGGCEAQPNAYFWNGNNIAMDPSYWPMEQYNFAGDTEEAITGFGKQQSNLIIFKSKSVGKAEYSLTTVSADDDNARLYIQMPYTAINSKIGCDLPNTIQLIENNLVFCNTKLGVHILHNTTPADENNIEQISRKVNGDGATKGLLKDVRTAGEISTSADYHENYWLIANGNAYLWDYELSTYNNPSWFFYDNINPVSFTQDGDDLYHLNAAGKLTRFEQNFSDYGDGIDKVYQFSTQYMGGYDRYKDVRSVMIAVRSDTRSETNVRYLTDYEDRLDLTPIESGTWTLRFRNLTQRYLGVAKYAKVVRRIPMCRHIRHFAMALENSTAGDDLSVVSAQIFYIYSGRQK